MGWAFLPPIQRTLAPPIAPVTRPAEFPAELSAWRSPAFTDSLSHAVVDTAPGGLIDGDGDGLGHPTSRSVPAPELTLLPPPRPTAVQRSVRPGAAAPRPATATGSVDVPSAPSLTRAPSVGMPLIRRAVVDDPVPDPAPVEPMESTEPVSVDSAEPPLAEAGSPTTSADSVTSVDHAVPPLGRAAVSSPEPLAPAGVPGTVQRSEGTPLASTTSSSPSATPVGETRPHLGLGPPLASVPATAVSAPPPDPDSGRPPLTGERPGISGFTEIPIQRTVSSSASAPVPPTSPTSPGMPPHPDLTLSRASDATKPVDPVPAASEPAAAESSAVSSLDLTTVASETSVQREVADASAPEVPADVAPDPVATTAPSPVVADPGAPVAISPVAATLTSIPLPLGGGLRTSIQRSSTLPGPGTPTPTLVVHPAPLLPGPPSRERVVPVQRMPATEPSSPPTRQTGSSPEGAQIVGVRGTTSPAVAPPAPGVAPPEVAPLLQRASASVGSSVTTGLPEEVSAAHEQDTVPPGPTALDGGDAGPSVLPPGAPAPASSGSTTAPSAALPVNVSRAVAPPTAPAIAPSITPRAAPGVLPLVRSAADWVPVQSAAVGAPEPGVVDVSGRSTPWTDASSALDAGQVVVARADDPAAVSDPAPEAAVGSPSGGGPPGAAGGGEDVDALAQRLFPPMLRRLKNELLLDRERRGMRTDAW
jgi:hypothetical protein